MEWNVEMILFMEEESWRRPLEQGWEIATNSSHEINNEQAPVVEKVDSTIQWINLYPVKNTISFCNTYLLDSDLSGR